MARILASRLVEYVIQYWGKRFVKNLDKIKKIVVQAKFDTPSPSSGINEVQSIPFGAFLAVKLRLKLNAEIVY